MAQRVHLLIRSESDELVRVEQHGHRWLLPCCEIGPTERPVHAAMRLVTRLRIPTLLAATPHRRISTNLRDTDWLAITPPLSDTALPAGTWGTWEAVDRLEKGRAIVHPQFELCSDFFTWVARDPWLRETGSREWLEDVTRWVNRAVTGPGQRDRQVSSWELFTASRARKVIAFRLNDERRVYFRATRDESAAEASLMEWLAQRRPTGAPIVLARERTRGWWLCAEADGAVLREDSTVDEHLTMVRRLAALQAGLISDVDTLEQLGVRSIPWETVSDTITDLLMELPDSPNGHRRPESDVHHACRAVNSVCARLEDLSLTTSWVDTDLFYGNVFVPALGLQIVDLEKSVLSIPHLACDTFLTNIARVGTRSRSIASAVRRAYHDEWQGYFPKAMLRELDDVSDVGARLLRTTVRASHTEAKLATGELSADRTALRRAAAHRLYDVLTEHAAASASSRC